MCNALVYKFSCGHDQALDTLPCETAEQTGNTCDGPHTDEIFDDKRCVDCQNAQYSAAEQNVLDQSLREWQRANGQDEEEQLRRVLEESMSAMSLGPGDFDDDELEKAMRMSKEEFAWGDFLTEDQWGGKSLGTATYGGRRAGSSSAGGGMQPGSRAAGGSSRAAATFAAPPGYPGPMEEEEEEEEEEGEEEEDEDEPEPTHAPTPAPTPQAVPEPDTSKPFLERFKTYIGCKHTVVEDTKIERENGSPPCLKAFERGNCPDCGGSVRQGKLPVGASEDEEDLLGPEWNDDEYEDPPAAEDLRQKRISHFSRNDDDSQF
jgi:hypothetical protein